MNTTFPRLEFRRCAFPLAAFLILVAAIPFSRAVELSFQVSIAKDLGLPPQTGRLVVILSRSEKTEPREMLGRTDTDAPYAWGCGAKELAAGSSLTIPQDAISFPINHPSELPAGDYFVQALLDSNCDLRSPDAPGNLYSEVQKVHAGDQSGAIRLELNHQIPPESLPPETEFVKFIKIQSRLLSEFHGRPIYLRAGIILPRDYAIETNRLYPLWVRIGGSRARFTTVNSLMAKKSDFRKVWLADGTPRMILLFLDGAGPYGDPYQVNSANNGPYGDAIVSELIPAVEKRLRALGTSRSRVLSGSSTGGWAALALQVFYPDFFNGVWSACPDPVDFRAFELVNIYEDTNAYVNRYGFERPSERTVTGETSLTLRREVQIENVLGVGDNWTRSGLDWGQWNAVFGPRTPNGHPAVLWDPQTGIIDHRVAEQWQEHDLHLVLERNWPTLGPKLQGKLHLAVGDADNYYLNNAVHLLDEFLTKVDPPYQGTIVYGPGKGHGWSNLGTAALMQKMAAVTTPPPATNR